jgi:2-(1,2-epoxy-1,2-dihydrophenyl)acetyl-CoA isomerase
MIKILNMVLESNIKNNCLVISFNSPKTSNSISADDWKELKKQIKNFEQGDLKYLVLNRVNENFSSGAQLAENLNASMEDVSEASKILWECKKPVISVVDGVCAGAASNMILLSDFIIATPETRYIEVFARRGLVVDFSGSWILPRIIGVQKAKELMMTASEVNGETLDKFGLLYKLSDKSELDNELEKLINLLDSQSFISICMIKDQIRKGLNTNFDDSLEIETVNQNNRFIHSDVMEGMSAFIEKRQPNYKNTLDE